MNGKFDIMVPKVQPLDYSITGTRAHDLLFLQLFIAPK
jgi:hypothetical protein